MLKAIKFIKHAVSKKDIDERLTAVHWTGKKVRAYNGIIVMEHKCPDIGTFSVGSDKLIKAIETCGNKAKIRLTEKIVYITDGKINIRLPIIKGLTAPPGKPKGPKMKVPHDLLEKLKILHKFISDDASRLWATSIRCQDGYLYATNNIVIARTKLDMPNATIPIDLIEVLLKAGEVPKSMVMTKTSVTFFYKKKAWLQGSLVVDQWPKFSELFENRKKTNPIPKDLPDIVNKLVHFTEDDTIIFKDNNAETTNAKYKDVGVSDISLSAFHLVLVLDKFDRANFKSELVSLDGDDIEGVMVSKV